MSVLKSIKGAFSNVQRAGTRALTKTSPRKPKQKKSRTFSNVDGVELDAGADLLNKFQQQWADMHEESESNALAAQKTFELIQAEYKQCERQNEAMNQLMALVSGLPLLLKDVTLVTDKISQMESAFSDLECQLVELEELHEQQELATNKLHHHHQLSLYKQRRNVQLEQVKVELAQQHATKVAGYEAQLQEHLRVKQEAFEEAFSKEIQHYRMYGSTQMRPLLSDATHQTQLADISIEEDRSELDEFLRSDDHGSSSPDISPDGASVTCVDDDDDEEGYVNISIVNNQTSSPENITKEPDKTTDQKQMIDSEKSEIPECQEDQELHE